MCIIWRYSYLMLLLDRNKILGQWNYRSWPEFENRPRLQMIQCPPDPHKKQWIQLPSTNKAKYVSTHVGPSLPPTVPQKQGLLPYPIVTRRASSVGEMQRELCGYNGTQQSRFLQRETREASPGPTTMSRPSLPLRTSGRATSSSFKIDHAAHEPILFDRTS